MTRLFFALSFIVLLSVAAYAQSGRAKGSTGKYPVPSPPPAPAASPTPDSSAKPSKPDLPKVVDGERIYTSNEVDERWQILKKPTPGYTREARRHNTRGYVILRAILAADEQVRHIEIVTGLPDGLSEKAIEAARQIKFKPAMKDGKPVSVWIEVEYRFQIY